MFISAVKVFQYRLENLPVYRHFIITIFRVFILIYIAMTIGDSYSLKLNIFILIQYLFSAM